jgi:hypothetical protein
VTLLKNMATSIQEMLDDRQAGSPSDPLEQITGIRTGNPKPPEDATLSRLLPGFVKDSQAGQATPEESNSVLRSLHEPGIIDAKNGQLELSEADAQAWIAAINDIRLALGTMLGIGPEMPDRLPAGHPMAIHLEVYGWLTVLQEYLVLGLMGKPIR